MEQYTPKIIEDKRTPDGKRGYVLMTFALEIRPCSICGRLIFDGPIDNSDYSRRQFPAYHKINAAAQVKAAGLVEKGYSPGSDRIVCVVCQNEGLVEFTCYCCGEKRKSDLFHSIESSEAFCEICHTTKPAKEWEAAISKAEEAHKYNY